MHSFFWAVGSLIILVPILYFLPLGLSKRGKWLIIILSFLLGETGLLAQSVLPIWEFIILLTVLIALIAYILDQRLGSVLFSSKNSSDEKVLQVDEKDSDVPNHMKERMMVEIDENFLNEKPMEIPSIEDHTLQLPAADSIQNIFKDASAEMLQVREDQPSLLSDDNLPPLGDYVKEDELVLTDTEENYLAEIEDMVNQAKHSTMDGEWMEQPENDVTGELLSAEEEADLSLMEEDLSPIKKEIMEKYILENVGGQDEKETAFSEDVMDDDGLIIDNLEQLADDFSLDSELVSFFGEVAASTEQIPMEKENNDLEQDQILVDEDVSFVQQHATKMESDESEEHTFEDDETSNHFKSIAHSGVLILQRQLLHTMVSQLKIVSKKMDPSEYEKLVRKHMHSGLPVHDYFTFASMLIEHYINAKDYKKLETLINNTRKKITGYPVIEEQLEFIYRYYCQENQ